MRATEKESLYNNLDKMSTQELLININKEDQKVAFAVERVIDSIQSLVDDIVVRMNNGGRLFYVGAGTSGRLGVVDASECPPTFGVSHDMIIGLMAGGDGAMRKAVEFAEDDTNEGWKDLLACHIDKNDVVIGIAASGTTPYVIGALEKCKKENILTGSITCNPGSPLSTIPNHPIVVEVGPEFITGSTRMKSGTAQKLVLNMISTSVMIKLGRVKGNRMVDMQLTNDKLVDRGIRMVVKELEIDYKIAKELLLKAGSVRAAIEEYQKS